MSVQFSEKSPLNFHQSTTAVPKTPFGIEDILYINNNSNNNNNNNSKNFHDKNLLKNSLKSSENSDENLVNKKSER